MFLQKRPLSEHRPVQGTLRKVSINNQFQVVDPFRTFGDALVLEAKALYASGFFRVSFFDSNDNPLMYIEGGQAREFSIEGQADENGHIEVSWDLLFPDGSAFVGDSVTMTVQVAPTQAGAPPTRCFPAPPCPPFRWLKEADWSQYDRFITLIGTEKDQDADDRLRYAMYAAVQGPLVDPNLQGSPYQLNPESQWYATWGEPQLADVRNWTWLFCGNNKQNVLSRLAETEYRNLFYMGHGNTDRLWAHLATDISEIIFQNEIASALQNPQQLFTQSHPYRFVFMYACCTGRGNMCRAFGIPKGRLSVGDFSRRKLRARAFIGSKDPDGACSSLSLAPGESGEPQRTEQERLTEFFRRWRAGYDDLNTILESVKQVTSGNQILRHGIDPTFTIQGAVDLMRRSEP